MKRFTAELEAPPPRRSKPKTPVKPVSDAELKTRTRRNQHFLRWVKENCCCKHCGARPPVPDLTFHHVRERRFGAAVLNALCSKTPGLFIEELLKGEFLCRPCHVKEHKKENK